MTTEPIVQVGSLPLRLRLLRWSVSPRLHAVYTLVLSAALWASRAELYVWVFVVLGSIALVPLVWVLTATGIVVGRHSGLGAPYAAALRWQALVAAQFGLHFYWLTQLRWGC